MRLAAYAGASTALAVGVVVHAFNQRPNFYSACVYLSQSNLSLMILTNLALFIVASFIYCLQRICYGPLRPIEVEQLYEKGWFAITETCLAMTIFRDEVGAWFLVMFVGLMAGKIWGWVGEGRVEILEQQPPANPRLFHIRLSISLAMSILYDAWLLSYAINSVIQQARPNMMVMFLFEFAILTTSSFSTALRYGISLIEAKVVKLQTQEMLETRRSEVRRQRQEMIREREAAAASGEPLSTEAAEEPLPSEDDIEEMDIEPPGWETKGHWVLTLDLMTDFVKLGIYTAFFFILLTFYGLPIHIMRDLFLTARSFIKRLNAFLKYRNATRDMNQRYPDATEEEIQREDTCIICREEMTPWAVTNPAPGAAGAGAPQPPVARSPIISERSRPKKLPCGHVLHLGCLKSWLERQQVCPTCRRPVVDTRPPGAQAPRPPGGAQPHLPGQLPLPQGPPAADHRARVHVARGINIGPLRFAFGRDEMLDLGPPPHQQAFPGVPPGQNPIPPNARVYGFEMGFPHQQGLRHPHNPQGMHTAPSGATNVQSQLQHLEQQIVQEIQSLSVAQAELVVVRQLQAELLRLRQLRAPDHQHPQAEPQPPVAGPASFVQRHEHLASTSAIPSGSPNLPAGVTIPEGWSLLPLQNMDTLLQPTAVQPQAGTSAAQEAAPASSEVNQPAAETGDLAAQPQKPAMGGTPVAGEAGVTPTVTSSTPPVADSLAATSRAAANSAPVEIVPNPLLTTPGPSADPTPTVPLAQPASSSSEVIEGTTSAEETDEAPLPDWSAPFVFPGQQAGEAAAGANPGILPSASQADEAQEATATADISANGSAAPEEVHTREEDSKGKGKAKSASVEEVKEDENDA
ncbi:E3 ubiquitin-protein ligase hrd1 [Pseudogymnoascus australis]